jgi:DNA modification methylase
VENKNKILFRGEIWKAKYNGGIDHPAPFPIEIPKNAILLASREGDTIVDPFTGSGTTGVAAIQAGRKFIGFEIDRKHVNTATERMELELAGMGLADRQLSESMSVTPLFA